MYQLSWIKKTSREFIERFHERHEAIYGYARKDEKLEIVSLRVYAIVKTHKPKLDTYTREEETPRKDALKERRDIYTFDTWIRAPVYYRDKLRCGNRLEGPALVEQYDSTIFIPDNWVAAVDQHLNIILTHRNR